MLNLSAARSRADQIGFRMHCEPVTLLAGSVEYALHAIPDHLGRFAREASGGRVAIDSTAADFVFLAGELPGRPERGWKVTHAGVIWQMLPRDGRAAWEYEPGDFAFVRLHCKRVTEAVND